MFNSGDEFYAGLKVSCMDTIATTVYYHNQTNNYYLIITVFA